MLAVGERFSVSPAQTGVVLAYILSVQQAFVDHLVFCFPRTLMFGSSFGWMVRQSAEVENDMNSVERVLHYATEVEQEAANEIPENKPPAPWPSRGHIEIKDIVLKYRPGLPAVIKGMVRSRCFRFSSHLLTIGISMTVQAGEKIGIVGR
jgi:ABC-type multidrug transport system fused ATPase/permease subunit